eukprot:TRINITY_DN5587_c0_g1_i2.p1 TRINITY_DN5587_c0_g1~~TRINITY_DN5587_c0_g1_i2.p1  ORF type:complete len:157 (+),score=38.57 TRINITY_DN5587_c0_g1_i2:131-601(+)
MILAIVIMNTHGAPRLTKFFSQMETGRQQEFFQWLHAALEKRTATPGCANVFQEGGMFGKDAKVVYRVFATLYFVVVIDHAESELAILDLIQVVVESLDKYFKIVCELDIVFNFLKVHQILDEIVVGGMVVETKSDEVIRAIRDIERSESRHIMMQ